jgi:hypothetical protein
VRTKVFSLLLAIKSQTPNTSATHNSSIIMYLWKEAMEGPWVGRMEKEKLP